MRLSLSGKVRRLAFAFYLTVVFLVACGGGKNHQHDAPQTNAGSWQYAVRLGDPQSRVHEMLGAASRATSELEEYPLSGVTVWFDREGRVTKLNFAGVASALYGGTSSDLIPSDRQTLFGLTGHTGEAEFRRILGVPTIENHERSSTVRELRCVWKKDGYVVDALFLAAERSHEGKRYPMGSLIWFDISRGL